MWIGGLVRLLGLGWDWDWGWRGRGGGEGGGGLRDAYCCLFGVRRCVDELENSRFSDQRGICICYLLLIYYLEYIARNKHHGYPAIYCEIQLHRHQFQHAGSGLSMEYPVNPRFDVS